jgi:hypothetical protein
VNDYCILRWLESQNGKKGVAMNEHLLQNITSRFSRLARSVRGECNGDAVWQKPGIKTLICVDGGRIRER